MERSGSLNDALDSAQLVIVGAGVFGLTIAERAASQLGCNVLILERRNHIGGNAHSFVDDATGIEVHAYGSHIFHTSNARVWEYVQGFTRFNEYRHRVLTTHRNRVYSLPINLDTLCAFYGRAMTPRQAEQLVRSQAAECGIKDPANLEERALASIGRPLYEAFIRGYTRKHWGVDPTQLPASVITRLPVRFTFDTRYFEDRWQGLPLDGYAPWWNAMARHPRIDVRLGIDFEDVRHLLSDRHVIVYTGPVDRYFDYAEGDLTWLSLDLQLRTHEVPDYQGTAVMNFADEDMPFTRVHEFRHLHPERTVESERTITMHETSRRASRADEAFYPVNSPADHVTLNRYRDRMRAERNVVFGGRLGSYQYLDMHVAIASALTSFDGEVAPLLVAQEAGPA